MLARYCKNIIVIICIISLHVGQVHAAPNDASQTQRPLNKKTAPVKLKPKQQKPLQLPTQNIRTRTPYDHRSQPLPEVMRRGSYTEENMHLPKSIEQEEYSRLLFIAVMQENIGAIKALLAKGANVNALDASQKSSPLVYSVIHNKVRSLNYLILRGADLDVAVADGKTALHFAVIKKNPTLINILIEAGADSKVVDQHNMYAIDYFTKQELEQNPQMVTRFMYGDLEESLLYAAKRDAGVAALYFLQQGANVNANDERGITPLLWAIRNNNKAMVSVLLNYGASLDVQLGNKVINAIDYARSGGDVEMLRILDTVKIRRELEANVQTIKYEAAPPLPVKPDAKEAPFIATTPKLKEPARIIAKPLEKLVQPQPHPKPSPLPVVQQESVKAAEKAKETPAAPPVYYRPGKAKAGQSSKSAPPISIIPESVAK